MSSKINALIRNERIKEFNPESAIWKKLNVEIFLINKYQYRFIKEDKKIDYFPTSGRYHNINTNEWGTVPAYGVQELFK